MDKAEGIHVKRGHFKNERGRDGQLVKTVLGTSNSDSLEDYA